MNGLTMAQGQPQVVIEGNMVGEADLRRTPKGHAVASFTIASTPRTFDRANNEWKDGTTVWLRCSAWRDLATNIAESCHKGTRVLATGHLVQDEWIDKASGDKRSALKLEVDNMGPSLLHATAEVAKAGAKKPQDDPWASTNPF